MEYLPYLKDILLLCIIIFLGKKLGELERKTEKLWTTTDFLEERIGSMTDLYKETKEAFLEHKKALNVALHGVEVDLDEMGKKMASLSEQVDNAEREEKRFFEGVSNIINYDLTQARMGVRDEE